MAGQLQHLQQRLLQRAGAARLQQPALDPKISIVKQRGAIQAEALQKARGAARDTLRRDRVLLNLGNPAGARQPALRPQRRQHGLQHAQQPFRRLKSKQGSVYCRLGARRDYLLRVFRVLLRVPSSRAVRLHYTVNGKRAVHTPR